MIDYERVKNDLWWLASACNNMPEYKKRMCQSAAEAFEKLLAERSAKQAGSKEERTTMKEQGMTAAERCRASGIEDVILFEAFSYDDALVGITEDGRAVYDYEKW